jgi:hypothetical protein
MTLHKPLLLAGCCFLIIFFVHFKKSLLVEGLGTGDLRNRVVGARMQKDGLSPYFFEWSPGDTARYYDKNNMLQIGVSNITASPFFHTLLSPIADLNQRTISHIWFGLEFVFILLTGLLAYLLAKNNWQKIVVLGIFTIFLFTEAWKDHIAVGQIYILIPMLTMIIYYCFNKPNKLSAAFMAGFAAIVLALLRPNSVIFFVPLLFLAGSYSRKYLLTFIIPIVLLPAVYFSFENNRTYWQEYAKAIKASIYIHQLSPEELKTKFAGERPKQIIRSYEGWDVDQIAEREKTEKLYCENGNVYIIYYYLFRRMLPTTLLNMLSLLSIVALLTFFILYRKKYSLLTLPNAALFGYCLYMVVDLFSPVCRNQYYGIEWLFPLLLAASVYKPANKWFYAALLLGLFLSVVNTSVIKMEHTMGEYVFLLALLALCLTRNLAPDEIQQQKKYFEIG